MLATVATFTLFSCNNAIDREQNVTEVETLNITITPEVENLKGSDLTKTYIDENKTIIWGENEQMMIAVLADGDATKATFGVANAAEGANGSPKTSFSASITPDPTGEVYTYVGLYPASASTNYSVTAQNVVLKAKQNGLENSYDPNSYILIARHEDGKTAENASWAAYYSRATALNKLTLKGIDEDIVSVTITAVGKNLAGYRTFDLLNDQAGAVTDGVDHVEINYATPLTGSDVNGVNHKIVWFNTWNVELAQGEPLTIVAKSATKTYTRTINANANGIKFLEGKLNTLGVGMANVTPVDIVTVENYVKVTSNDDLTSGQYLIVYEAGNVAFNGGLETLDAASNTISVTISDGVIESNATTDAAAFTIETTAGTIQSASGYYIGQTSDANGLAASENDAYSNTISYYNNAASISSSGGAFLRYNKASNQLRFRYYKSSSYASQEEIQLYKKTSTTPSPQIIWNLSSIEIATPPTKVTYSEGETFSPAGMVVNAIYTDESDVTNTKREVIAIEALTFDPALNTPLTLNDNAVTITYEDKTAIQTITVEDHFVNLNWTYPTEGAATAEGIAAISGVVTNGLGGDYAESHAPYRIKLDTDGDYIQIKTDAAIGEVSVAYKKIGGDGNSTLTIKESSDGVNWSNVESLSLTGAQNYVGTVTSSNSFNSASRYVQIYFNRAANVGIGGITITKLDTTPRFTVEGPIAADIAGGEYTANITRKYFDGEITVTVPEGCDWITASNVAAGTNALSLTVAANTGVARSATLTLSATDVTAQELVVNQEGNEPGSEANPYTVAQALAAIDALESGSTDVVWVSGVISRVTEFRSNYHSITYYISADGTQASELEVYSGKGVDGANFTDITDLAVGDQVTVKGNLTEYNSTPEFSANSQITAINYVTRYTVTYNNDGNGSVSGPTNVGAQGSVTVTVTPNSGYELDVLTVGGVDVTAAVSSNAYTFAMPAANVNVSATFIVKSSTDPTVEPITNGTFTSANSKLTLTTASGVTIEQTKVSGSTNVNASYNTVSTLRVYKGHALTFSGKTFTRIEIVVDGTYYGNTLTASSGTLTPTTTSGGTIVWEGEASSVTITNTATQSNTQLRTKSFSVTYN